MLVVCNGMIRAGSTLQYNLVRGVRDRQAKYVYWANDRDELYDLARDPWERYNLAADPDRRDLLQTCRERLLDHMERTADPFLRGVRTNLENIPTRSTADDRGD